MSSRANREEEETDRKREREEEREDEREEERERERERGRERDCKILTQSTIRPRDCVEKVTVLTRRCGDDDGAVREAHLEGDALLVEETLPVAGRLDPRAVAETACSSGGSMVSSVLVVEGKQQLSRVS